MQRPLSSGIKPRTLHLIRHAMPAPDPQRPSHEWELAPGVLDHLGTLLDALHPRPDIIVSSEEPKAQATASATAAALDVPWRTMLGLHEQLRYTAPFHTDRVSFAAEIQRLFAHPSEVVFGEESADMARERFTAALNAVMAANPQPCAGIVTHGTVRSLYVAHANRQEAYTLWQQQNLLDVITVTWPSGRLSGR